MEKKFCISSERARLKANGVKVSQADIAAALGVNQTTVMRWEKNPSIMKPFIIDAVRRFFDEVQQSHDGAAQ